MTEKYRVHDIVKFNYSDISEYVDEYHTDTPLRNDEVVNLLNRLTKENEQLKSEINMLKTTISRNEAYIKRLTHKGEWKRSCKNDTLH